MINPVGKQDRDRAGADIEDQLHKPGPVFGKRLRQGGRAADDQRFRQTEFHHGEQDDEEAGRHRPGDSRQLHFQPGSQDGNQQVAESLKRFPAGPMHDAIDQCGCAHGDHQADEDSGSDLHRLPRVCLATHACGVSTHTGAPEACSSAGAAVHRSDVRIPVELHPDVFRLSA